MMGGAKRSTRKPRFGLAAKLTLIVGVLLFSLLGATTLLSFNVAERGTLSALERQGDAIASTLNHAFEVLVDQGQLFQLQRVATNTVFLPDVRAVTVVDKDGKVLACTDRRALGKPTTSARIKSQLAQGEFAPFVSHDGGDLVIVRPLYSGHYANGTDTGLVGAVEVVLDQTNMQAEAEDTALGLLGIQLGAYALLSALVALSLRWLVTKPLYRLYDAAQRARAGDRSTRSSIRTSDEIGVVSEAFDELAAEVERTVDTLESKVAARTRSLEAEGEARRKALTELEAAHAETSLANRELEGAKIELEAALDDSMRANEALAKAHHDIERAHEELVASVEERLRLADTIRELSTPVMRVHRGILTMPLVGKIDEARAKQIEEKLLAGIERHDANEVILDLSGVPFVDTDVARALVRAKRCAELVGARVALVGLRGDVAKSVVRAGIDLSGMTTLADLEGAIFWALRHRGLEIRPLRRSGVMQKQVFRKGTI